jgi:hypothetical protein
MHYEFIDCFFPYILYLISDALLDLVAFGITGILL